jgi:hypothetical protein
VIRRTEHDAPGKQDAQQGFRANAPAAAQALACIKNVASSSAAPSEVKEKCEPSENSSFSSWLAK